jgi:hypothetical protein
MDKYSLTRSLRQLRCEERYNMIYGPGRKDIERTLGCRVLTFPVDQLGQLSADVLYFLVRDPYKGKTYLAVMQPLKQ